MQRLVMTAMCASCKDRDSVQYLVFNIRLLFPVLNPLFEDYQAGCTTCITTILFRNKYGDWQTFSANCSLGNSVLL